MFSSLPVYLLFSLISFVYAGYKLDPFDPKYPNYVHIKEAPGHRTWIEIDANGKNSIWAQIAIMKDPNNQYMFAKKNEGEDCVDFYSPYIFGFESACDNTYNLFAEDYYRFRRRSLDQFKQEGCVTDDKKKVDPIHFKGPNGNRFILMGEKYNIGDVNSPKLIGTYDEKMDTFSAPAYETKVINFVQRNFATLDRKQFDPKKWEVFCPNHHNYLRK